MELRFNLSAHPIAQRLLWVVLGLITLSTIGRILLFHFPQIPGVTPLAIELYLDEEGNLPALYSALALGFAAGLLGLIAHLERWLHSTTARSWRILSWTFLYLAIDEVISLHELLIQPFRRLGLGGFFHYAWVVPGLVAVGGFGLWSVRLLRQLPRRLSQRFLLSGGLFVLGALGFEMLDGKIVEQIGEANALFDPLYQCLMTCEEGLEMLAIVLFIHSLLQYLNHHHGMTELKLQLSQSERPIQEIER
jgi:hypothetical protein